MAPRRVTELINNGTIVRYVCDLKLDVQVVFLFLKRIEHVLHSTLCVKCLSVALIATVRLYSRESSN